MCEVAIVIYLYSLQNLLKTVFAEEYFIILYSLSRSLILTFISRKKNLFTLALWHLLALWLSAVKHVMRQNKASKSTIENIITCSLNFHIHNALFPVYFNDFSHC